jgi:predicted TIM-barrel fold metal-dependent hydrolase
MIGDALVADAVVHPYNLAPANQEPTARAQLDAVYAAHRLATDEAHAEYRLSREEFFSDFSFEAMASALFLESPVDFAVIHSLPNLGFCKDYVTDPRLAAAFRDRHPGRLRMYATVDTPVTATAIEQLEWQVRELEVDGLKLYPAFFYDGVGEGWRLDGDDFAVPLLEAARDLGIRNVAIHKALWLPPAPRQAFSVDDVEAPLDRFPDLNFQIVHAGMAFLDQTADLLARHRNLYATLESMFAFILVRPRLFAEILGRLLAAGGSERLMFASGTNLMHPRPILEAFERFELPADLVEEHGFAQLTERDRRNILGENILRLHGLDAEHIRARVAGDEFELARVGGYAAPWNLLRPDRVAPAPR